MKMAPIRGNLHHILSPSVYLRAHRFASTSPASSGESAAYNDQRFAPVLLLRDIYLILARRQRHHLPDDFATPRNPIQFLPPQTGPNPHHTSRKRRQRGSRVHCPVSLSEDSSQIRCGWAECGEVLAYDEQAITAHINMAHIREGEVNSCQWRIEGEDICRQKVQPENLRRHILGQHTNLMVKLCEWCQSPQRRDMMSRHKQRCPQRPNNL